MDRATGARIFDLTEMDGNQVLARSVNAGHGYLNKSQIQIWRAYSYLAHPSNECWEHAFLANKKWHVVHIPDNAAVNPEDSDSDEAPLTEVTERASETKSRPNRKMFFTCYESNKITSAAYLRQALQFSGRW